MKKTILTIIVCLAHHFVYAEQITPVLINLEDIPRINSYSKINDFYVTKSKKQQVLIDTYNLEDFSIGKQINFTIQGAITDSIGYSHMILEQFILVLCLNTSASYEAGDNNYQNLKLYDIQGNLIYDFGEAYIITYGIVGQISSNKLLLHIERSTVVDNTVKRITEYYTLTQNSVESGTQNVQVEKKAAFPCPARGEVNIPTREQQGNLRVLNLKGQTIDSQRIQEGDYQRVNTESYPAGTYIYQAGNETGKFMVE